MNILSSRPRIIVYSPLQPAYIEELKEKYEVDIIDPNQDVEEQLHTLLPEADGMIGAGVSQQIGAAQLANAQKLKVISTVSVGYDAFDVAALTEQGIMLTNTPDVLTETTADLGFALLMSAARRIPELDKWTKAGNWQSSIGNEWFASDIHHKKMGIIGMGRIGAAIARRGHHGFNMSILYHGRHQQPELEQELGAQYCDLTTLLHEADFVVVVVPLTEQTRGMLGTEQFAAMQPHAIFINLARGAVVDEEAMINALQSGLIRGAGLDVYQQEPLTSSPLFELDNVVTLPHVGSATGETRAAMHRMALDDFHAALAGNTPQHIVNPEVINK